MPCDLEREQPALDRADRRRRDVAVLGRQLGSVLADVLQHRAQVFDVEQQSPASSAILNVRFSTPSCVSFNCSRRASSSGPKSETVARIGWPRLPKTSQNTTGHAS